METSIWVELAKIFAGILTGAGGVFAIVKVRAEKKKTPYDMFMGLLEEMKTFYAQRNADYEREKLDSAEKSSVIMQSHFCKHKYTDPNVVCPVDLANDERLKKRCERIGYCPLEHKEKENEQN